MTQSGGRKLELSSRCNRVKAVKRGIDQTRLDFSRSELERETKDCDNLLVLCVKVCVCPCMKLSRVLVGKLKL